MSCPNTNLEEWKLLVASRGEDVAYALWDLYDGNVPESESKSEIVKSGLKATNILQSPKADQFFNAVAKNKITGDFFWKKMQADLGIPKEQIEILKSFNTQDKGELISSLLANYSYSIEINTAKEPTINKNVDYENNSAFDEDGNFQSENTTFNIDGYLYEKDKFKHIPFGYGKIKSENGYIGNSEWQSISEKEYEQALDNFKTKEGNEKPTQYYSNLTVPGGTNGTYKELNFETPLIVPSIQGHAQFSTENSIGWARVADKQTYNSVEEVIELMKQNKVLTIEC